MIISLSTILNTTIWVSLLILILLFLLQKPCRFLNLSIPVILLAGILTLFRLLLPVEYFFTYSVPIEKLLPTIYMALRTPIMQLGAQNILFYHILFAIWMSGIIFCFIKMARSYHKLQLFLSSLETVEDPTILSLLDSINHKFKKPVHFLLVRSPDTISPFITGFRTPTIILSDAVLDKDKLPHILNHELHHFYRKHLWLKFLFECVRNIYFWNPLVHMLTNQLNFILELDVDKTVTDTYDEPDKLTYMECLFYIYRLQYEENTASLPGIAFTTTQTAGLRQRFDYLLNPPEREKGHFHSVIFYGILSTLIFLSVVFICEPCSVPKDIDENTVALDSSNSYFLKRTDGTYDVYYNDEYKATVTQIFDPSIPVKVE